MYGADVLDESPRFRLLVEQLRRCAVSVPANIAEGAGSESQRMFARYLGIALASACELEGHLLLCRDVSCASPVTAESLLAETVAVKKMLTALVRQVRRGSPRRTA